MPKRGMEPIRRASLVEAAIAEIGSAGTLDVTVGQIARRAGVSSALAHHYFGAKDQLILAAMRHVLTVFGRQVRDGLSAAATPRARLEAVIRACFGPDQFRPEVVAAWLNFYVLASTSAPAGRLLRVYHGRMRANLRHDLRPLIGARAPATAEAIAALIDGIYIGQALNRELADGVDAVAPALRLLDLELAA
ncbi:MAG: transcriptional regulator BetI [Pseudomonadota bacterium]